MTTYCFNAADQVTTQVDSDGVTTYTYDAAGKKLDEAEAALKATGELTEIHLKTFKMLREADPKVLAWHSRLFVGMNIRMRQFSAAEFELLLRANGISKKEAKSFVSESIQASQKVLKDLAETAEDEAVRKAAIRMAHVGDDLLENSATIRQYIDDTSDLTKYLYEDSAKFLESIKVPNRAGKAGNAIPQKSVSDLNNESRQALLEIEGSQRLQNHSTPWRNRDGRLPDTGTKKPRYIEYTVDTPGSVGPGGRPNRGDRRIMRDTANDLWYYTGNAHAGGGKNANFIEIVNPPKNVPFQ